MHKDSSNKLLNAGFTLLDAAPNPRGEGFAIFQKTPERRDWHIREKGFDSKAALYRRLQHFITSEPLSIDLYDSLHKDVLAIKIDNETINLLLKYFELTSERALVENCEHPSFQDISTAEKYDEFADWLNSNQEETIELRQQLSTELRR